MYRKLHEQLGDFEYNPMLWLGTASTEAMRSASRPWRAVFRCQPKPSWPSLVDCRASVSSAAVASDSPFSSNLFSARKVPSDATLDGEPANPVVELVADSIENMEQAVLHIVDFSDPQLLPSPTTPLPDPSPAASEASLPDLPVDGDDLDGFSYGGTNNRLLLPSGVQNVWSPIRGDILVLDSEDFDEESETAVNPGQRGLDVDENVRDMQSNDRFFLETLSLPYAEMDAAGCIYQFLARLDSHVSAADFRNLVRVDCLTLILKSVFKRRFYFSYTACDRT